MLLLYFYCQEVNVWNIKRKDYWYFGGRVRQILFIWLPSNGRDRVERTVVVKALRRSAEGGGARGEGEASPPVEDHGSCRVQWAAKLGFVQSSGNFSSGTRLFNTEHILYLALSYIKYQYYLTQGFLDQPSKVCWSQTTWDRSFVPPVNVL